MSKLSIFQFFPYQSGTLKKKIYWSEVDLQSCINLGVPVMAQWLTNPTRNHEVAGLIPGLTQWVKYLELP